MILLIWVSSKVRNFLRKCLRSTASPLCTNKSQEQKSQILIGITTVFQFSTVIFHGILINFGIFELDYAIYQTTGQKKNLQLLFCSTSLTLIFSTF